MGEQFLTVTVSGIEICSTYSVQFQEIKELQAMAARDTTSENREYFKNELASAIRDIRNDYDQVRHAVPRRSSNTLLIDFR